MKTKRFRAIVGFITSALLILVSVWVVSGRATGSQRADTSFEASYPPPTKPALSRIAANGAGWNFELVGQNPLLDRSGRATGSQRADTSFEASYPPPTKPALSRIAANGAGWNFELVGQNPLLD